jgi:tRNA pseudouridine13 synthase
MRWPEGKPAKIEGEMLSECVGDESAFDAHRALGEGSRRPFVLRVAEIVVETSTEDPSALPVLFVLPKGGYATTLLTGAVALHEPMVKR